MKKYYNPATKKEYALGDHATFSTTAPGGATVTLSTPITKEILPILLEAGLLKEKSDKPELLKREDIPMDLMFYVNLLAQNKDWTLGKTVEFLNEVSSVHPNATFDILQMVIAKYLDEQYPDHIKNSPRIFGISASDGKVIEVYKEDIANFRNFAAFRSPEDAGIACRILRDIKRCLFKKSGK
ncbi:hypothetical protein KNV38_gp054 [uncultured phage cr111_1]|uniref:Uncharacterized protein n=1 Tax=uncultured phage cr111_1 TaxID=2772071 RepID=A0A7M1RYD1_9CAUD|nr:hypothetical protein KNV38_gp054 [uncultured phage cr111_1]QOR59174.1 hypothetical protein [uncultured phage cr111_1]